MKNIVLIGFMGTGKSMTGGILSEKLDRVFVDIDSIIEEKTGMSISKIFSDLGEDYFRKLESETVEAISALENRIIATGGGVVLNPENMTLLKKNGLIIWLEASAELIRKRTKEKEGERPLLDVTYPEKTISEMLSYRSPLYDKWADYKINTDKLNPEESAEKIIEFIKTSCNKTP